MEHNDSQNKQEFEMDTSKEFTSDKTIIDQILSNYGYGFKIWLQILIYFFSKMLEGISNIVIPLLVIPYHDFYKISSFKIFLISSSFYAGSGIGSLLTGYILHFFKRQTLIRLCTFFFLIFYVTFAFFQNLILVFICRFLMGLMVGILLIVTQCCLTEYLPINNRSLMMSMASSGVSIGGLTIACIFLIFMPNLEPENIQLTLLMSSILILLIFIFISSATQDSPRNLILNNYDEEGFKILETIYGGKLRESDKIKIKEEINSIREDHISSLKDIFTNYYFTTTLVLIFIILIIDLASQGPPLVSVFTIKSLKLDTHGEKETNRHVILNQITLSALIIPMQFVGGFLSELKNLGRKRVIFICFLISSLFFGACCVFYHHFSLLLGTGLAFLEAPATLTIIYANEVYNTNVRDMALGFLSCFKSLGGFTSQIIYIEIRKIHMFVPYYFTILILVIASILVFFLPYETSGKALDQRYINLEETCSEEKQALKKE
jgi:MFS transporter, putative metabolite transport protein